MNEERLNDWFASRKKLKEDRSAEKLFSLLKEGNMPALSAAITLLESTLLVDEQKAKELIRLCMPLSGNSFRLGITGVPGVGKSSFIEEFGKIILEKGKKIAVLAVDPSSERTGGSILGDKTRMFELSHTEGVFIRPSAAGSTLGGVARKTREAIILCEAAGYDLILIETVGVGQSETMVHSMVDFFLLLLLAGAGDELQGIKRGIMEMADGLAVTKADGENNRKAQLAARELKNAIHLFPPTSNGWIPEVKTCSSLENDKIDEVWEMIARFEQHTRINGSFSKKRQEQDQNWMHEALKDMVLSELHKDEIIKTAILKAEDEIKLGVISPFEAAENIFKLVKK